MFALGSLTDGLGANYFISLRVNKSISKRKFAAKRQRKEEAGGGGWEVGRKNISQRTFKKII